MTRAPDPLALLLLPCGLEDFEFAANARDLLAIPRVLALEPRRGRLRRPSHNLVCALQARRVRLPGALRVLVLYHAAQYPLARALLGAHGKAELWYLPSNPENLTDEALIELDQVASERSVQVLKVTPDGDQRSDNEPLRARLRELEVISHRPYTPVSRAASRFGSA